MTRTCVLWKRFVVLLPDDFEYSTSRFANPERTSNQVSAIAVSRQPNAAAKCSHTSYPASQGKRWYRRSPGAERGPKRPPMPRRRSFGTCREDYPNADRT
jgi:hypothetical protein